MRRRGPGITRRHFLGASARVALGLSGASLLGCVRSESGNAPADPLSGYKALVCVFLYGGNDGYNMMVPTTRDKYESYAAARLDLAVPQGQLLSLRGMAADGCNYGLHPRCPELAGLFNGGHAAMLANVGTLLFPTLRGDYTAGRVPNNLFSHSDQMEQWQTSRPDAIADSGWAGRVADVLGSVNGNTELPLNISISGTNLLQRGNRSHAFPFFASGPQHLVALPAEGPAADLRASFDLLQVATQEDLFERTYAETLGRGIRLNQLLAAELEHAPELTALFPANDLGNQLKLVARLIGVRERLGMRRQIFFVSMSGFDTHGDQSANHPELLARLSQGLAAFHAATVELGVADDVTAFTASDFGRSLTVNGKGTDHGWSNHQWIVGGAVRGGAIYGMPPSLVPDADDDTRGGRFIPQTSVDEFAATLVRWFGISDHDLNYVLPNIGRFASRDLGFL